MSKAAVVILNWNGKNWLEKFLPSVVAHSSGVADVYLVDNASTDESIAFVNANFPTVKTVILDKNYGFAGGYNLALQQIQSEYYILLNSDVEVTENWISPLISFMDLNPEIAACQPKVRSFYEKNKFEYAGAGGGLIDKWGYPFCRGRIFNVCEEDHGQYDDTTEIFWASGAALFIRSELFHKVGGFDEDFFAHMEEIDLCWRLKNYGYKIYYHGGATVFHVGGGTLSMGSSRKVYLNFRNNLQLLSKNLPSRKSIPLILWRLVLDGVAGISFIPHPNGWQNCLAVIKAHFSYYRMFFSVLKKKRQIPKRKVSCIYPKSIVFAFYALGKKTYNSLRHANY